MKLTTEQRSEIISEILLSAKLQNATISLSATPIDGIADREIVAF